MYKNRIPVENKTHPEFLKYYEPIHKQFSRFCRAITGSAEDAEDLIQDTILNVPESFNKIWGLSVFKSYLIRVASNLIKMKQRRKKFSANFNEKEIRQIADHG